jgi:hypothetical protein
MLQLGPLCRSEEGSEERSLRSVCFEEVGLEVVIGWVGTRFESLCDAIHIGKFYFVMFWWEKWRRA